MKSKPESKTRWWWEKHNRQLPPFEEVWQQNQHRVVLGLQEDAHIGELGIRRPPQVGVEEDAGLSV